MFQNIKVDIAYYKTNTDFEMEFNLCGCCRMRLLTDKVADKKALVHSLARAVSRSRVIIIVGNLFGSDGIINVAAGATGSSLSAADNKAYGISSNDEISIINGSTPLVTPEGYFGGCIIEKGPQTMILLTENKTVRKSVMKNLIHPYIEELCAIDLKEKAASASLEASQHETEEADIVDEDVSVAHDEEAAEYLLDEDVEEQIILPENDDGDMDIIIDTEEPEAEIEIPESDEDLDFVFQDDDVADEPVVVENEGEEYEFLADDEAENEEPEEEIELLTDDDGYEDVPMEFSDSDDFLPPHDAEESESDFLYDEQSISFAEIRRRNIDYYKKEENFDDMVTQDESFEREGILKGHLGKPILIISIVLLALLIILCYCIFYVPTTEGVSASEYLKETFNTLFG